MKKDTTTKYLELIKDNIDSEKVQSIIAKMVEQMRNPEALADELEEMTSYTDYLTESEAREITSRFENWDGSTGPHWRDPRILAEAAQASGTENEIQDCYNSWAFFTTMNMAWSDLWGVLRNFISQEDETKACAQLAKAILMDPDGGYAVREYFSVDD